MADLENRHVGARKRAVHRHIRQAFTVLERTFRILTSQPERAEEIPLLAQGKWYRYKAATETGDECQKANTRTEIQTTVDRATAASNASAPGPPATLVCVTSPSYGREG